MGAAIETHDLVKRFPRHTGWRDLVHLNQPREWVAAVAGVSIEVAEGEIFGLLGANGAGKTTLIKMLCGLILPTSGSARVAGCDPVRDGAALRRSIALVDGTERSFFWRLSGRQNLEFFGSLYGLEPRELRRRVDSVLDLVGLAGDADRRFQSYSAGMRQRLALARALLPRPKVLFLDEPTRSLDPLAAHELRTFVRRVLVDGFRASAVLVTHDMNEAEQLCRRVAVMASGHVIACGSPSDLKRAVRLTERYCIQVRGLRASALALLAHIRGLRAIEELRQGELLSIAVELDDAERGLPLVLATLLRSEGHIVALERDAPTLEDAFLVLLRPGEPAPEPARLSPGFVWEGV